MQEDCEHGFSLLETIIALVILSLAMATLFDSYGGGIRAISAANQHSEARILAQSLMSQVNEPASPSTSSGNHNGLAWQLTIKPATGDLASINPKTKWHLLEAVAVVKWKPGRSIILRSLRLGSAK